MSKAKIFDTDLDIQTLTTDVSYDAEMYHEQRLAIKDDDTYGYEEYTGINAVEGLVELVKLLDKRLSAVEAKLRTKNSTSRLPKDPITKEEGSGK